MSTKVDARTERVHVYFCVVTKYFLTLYRKYTVNEVVSMLEDEGGFMRADIHIQPPPVKTPVMKMRK